ncbi:SufD family Fe-S cluster assembly protein [Oenococcus sp. UCMA 17063]|nr:SufD family Fe-S cluster assembly protein [Oenococcus sp. UCMA 17063]
MIKTRHSEFFKRQLDNLSDLHEVEWLTENRKKAFSLSRDLNWPDYPRVLKTTFQAISAPSRWSIEEEKYFFTEKSQIRIEQLNLSSLKIYLSSKLQKLGVIVMDLFEAAEKKPDLVQKYLQSDPDNRLLAMHQAYWNCGLLIYLPNDLHLKHPIEISLIVDDYASAIEQHILFIAGSNVKATVVQTTKSSADLNKVQLNSVFDLIAGPGSHLDCFAVDQLNHSRISYFNRFSRLGTDAQVNWLLAEMNLNNLVGECSAILNGNGSQANLRVVSLADREQKQALMTKLTHIGQHTTGNINQRGVILQRGRLIYNAVGKIVKGAHGANSEQTSRILLLSPTATGDANPILLIDENDVEAGHAASIGRVSPEQLYYLMSRGLTVDRARQLLVKGFFDDLLDRLPINDLRVELDQALERRLLTNAKKSIS